MTTIDNSLHDTLEINSGLKAQAADTAKKQQQTAPLKEDKAPDTQKQQPQTERVEEAKPVSKKEEPKEAIVEALNKTVEIFDNGIRFILEEDNKEVVVEVFNKETGEVIRRIPPEDVLQSADNISELVGLLIDKVG